MLTAKADDDLRVQLLREGAQDYLLKPFVPEELRARVNNLIALKQAQEQLIERNVHLNAAVAELENANQELDAFSYSVSHDLRAPLRAIHGFTSMLVEDLGEQLSTDARHYMARIQHNVLSAQSMIDALIALARLGRQPLTREWLEPEALVQEVLQDLSAEQQGRQLEIRVGDLPTCQADPTLLRHVYSNLISNALKYTQKRESALVEIGCLSDSGKNVYFVRDNGAGFDMTYADRLFGVFQRMHRPDEFEGTGIGLAIVRRVIHRHGGRIWAEAAVDQGAAFYFELNSR
jgi:light-regulated signal transduction histidine kinase (bacteriophytochrome)